VLVGNAIQGTGKKKERCWSTVRSPGSRRDGQRELKRPDGDAMAFGMLQTGRRRGARFRRLEASRKACVGEEVPGEEAKL
jgi:hypothetical protein